ncbi:hypothetical protein HB364_14070 [Pseudoflavitalea sp. X16]|uniref:hypothetical protein n=1 Tax=Paraflavitalea devenefica TaxID=2716334 RepID=UPI001420623E|nr:hypothetical protein [Paraflavitalea devenefica]NII26216.1 hypothetical protein [Paraflavitalea devenefica]
MAFGELGKELSGRNSSQLFIEWYVRRLNYFLILSNVLFGYVKYVFVFWENYPQMKKFPFSYSTFPNIYRRARRKAAKNKSSIAKEVHGFLLVYVEDEPELPEDSLPIEYESLKPKTKRKKPDPAVEGAQGEPLGDEVGPIQEHENGIPPVEQTLGKGLDAADVEEQAPNEEIPGNVVDAAPAPDTEEVLGEGAPNPDGLNGMKGRVKGKVPAIKKPSIVAPMPRKGGANSQKNGKGKKGSSSQRLSSKVKTGKPSNAKQRSK